MDSVAVVLRDAEGGLQGLKGKEERGRNEGVGMEWEWKGT